MINCKQLVDALTGTYNGTYVEFEKNITHFVKRYMSSLCDDQNYIPLCFVKENPPYLGKVIGTDCMFLNKKVITGLKNGNKIYLLVISHELSHIEQNIQIQKGVATPNIIQYIKDILLDEYQISES